MLSPGAPGKHLALEPPVGWAIAVIAHAVPSGRRLCDGIRVCNKLHTLQLLRRIGTASCLMAGILVPRKKSVLIRANPWFNNLCNL